MRFNVSDFVWLSKHSFTRRAVVRFVATLTAVLVLASLAIVPATADTVSIETSADAWTRNGTGADNNYGTQSVILPSGNPDLNGTVMFARYSTFNKFWERFDFSSISGTADSATLQMTRVGGATTSYDAILVFALNDGDVGEGWGEYTITYNNAPGNILADPYHFDSPERYTYLGALDYSANGPVGEVLTLSSASLLNAVNGDSDGQLTLAFSKRGFDPEEAALFASREDPFYQGGTLVLTGVTATIIPGDVNFDGVVNIFDINLVSANWGTPGGPTGDANGDGNVDIFDINLISANWTPTGGAGSAAAVPEPSTFGLAAAGSSLLMIALRKRKSAGRATQVK